MKATPVQSSRSRMSRTVPRAGLIISTNVASSLSSSKASLPKLRLKHLKPISHDVCHIDAISWYRYILCIMRVNARLWFVLFVILGGASLGSNKTFHCYYDNPMPRLILCNTLRILLAFTTRDCFLSVVWVSPYLVRDGYAQFRTSDAYVFP